MTKAERDALRALEAKATQGALVAELDMFEECEISASICDQKVDLLFTCEVGIKSTDGDEPWKRARESQVFTDAQLLAAARNSIRALLNQIDDAEAVHVDTLLMLQGEYEDPESLAVVQAIRAYNDKHGAE